MPSITTRVLACVRPEPLVVTGTHYIRNMSAKPLFVFLPVVIRHTDSREVEKTVLSPCYSCKRVHHETNMWLLLDEVVKHLFKSYLWMKGATFNADELDTFLGSSGANFRKISVLDGVTDYRLELDYVNLCGDGCY